MSAAGPGVDERYCSSVSDEIRVMVVDDADHVRRMLIDLLDVDGFEVVAAAGSGAEALEQLDAAEPDVAVVDYKMPEMDGLETCRRMRAARPDQRIILYTAFLDADVEQEAKQIGVDLCLGKIEGLPSLETEITRLVRG